MSRETVNPYMVMDGPWGGWGMPTWHNCQHGWKNTRDVLEREYSQQDKAWRWIRVWESTTEVWRDLTSDEIEKLPPPEKAC